MPRTPRRISAACSSSSGRGRELWDQLGSLAEFLHVPQGQSRYHVYCGELELALRLDKELLRVSRQRNDSSRLVLAHQAYGTGQMVCGRFASSRSHLEAVLALTHRNASREVRS
jgi:hypothetical protein